MFEAGWTSRALDLAERVSPDVVIAGEADLCRRLRAGEPGGVIRRPAIGQVLGVR